MNSKAKQRAAATGGGRSEERATDEQPTVARTQPSGIEAPGGVHFFEIAGDDLGKRLDRFLADRLVTFAGLSRTRLQALIVAGHARIDGEPHLQPSAKLAASGVVTIDIPPAAAPTPIGQDLPLDIVFEDAHLLVLDKPAGLVVHPAAGHADGTLVNALIAHCGDSLSGIGGVRRPGIVHRLDKDTSGLMVVAKTDAAHRGLSELFADHGRSGSLERSYRAFVWGVPETRQGSIDRALGRHPADRKKVAVVAPGRGRHAVTHWRLDRGYGSVASAVWCTLETGRTHQIRVHFAELGHPLIGDPVYGAGFRTKASRLPPAAREAIAALGRQALHAATLGFDHPVTGEALRFESALPGDLTRLDDALAELG